MDLIKKIFSILAVISLLIISGGSLIAQAQATQLQNGTLVLAQGQGTVYYIENGTKRAIDSAETFRLQGFQWVVKVISPEELALYPDGELITKDSALVFPGQGDAAPDLAPFAAKDLQLANRDGRLLLFFTAEFWNRGKGPLELDATSSKPVSENTYETAQRLALPNGSVRSKVVGNLFWHEIHKHFHFDDFASYVLEMVPSGTAKGSTSLVPSIPGLTPMSAVLGVSTVAPAIVNKSTFCIYETEHIALPTEGPNKAKKSYTACGKLHQGISVGWADKYSFTLPDQNFDITDLPAGIYRIGFVLDPHQHFMEGSRDNNSSVAFVEINPPAGTMRVIASGAPFYTPENQYPDGMLIRSESDPTVYVMQNNKKQLLPTVPSGQIYILPKGVFDAIPSLSLIQATGSPAIYVLNTQGFRRGITSMEVFNSYGYRLQDVTQISQSDLARYPETDFIQKQGDTKVYSISTHASVNTVANPASVHIVNQTDFESYMVGVVATGLFVPWDAAFLPGGDLLVPERSGTLRRIGQSPAVINVPGVFNSGEGGLMGLALHPSFATNNLLYLYFTSTDNGQKNRVASFQLIGNQLSNEKIIIDNIPSAIYHDGGRIAFGPDGMLYITTGDSNSSALAQDLTSLAGKTLRLTPDGQIPVDNPFSTAVWSYGHRNSQGIAWDSFGRMWETEHGPTVGAPGENLCCRDEINLIEKGKNYGWPIIRGDETRAGMVAPMLNSGPNVAWAPAGIAVVNGSLYFAGLKGATLYQIRFNADGSYRDLQSHFTGKFGRLRAVVPGPDGSLYLSTSNRDGRGTVLAGDDKILRVYPGLVQSFQ